MNRITEWQPQYRIVEDRGVSIVVEISGYELRDGWSMSGEIPPENIHWNWPPKDHGEQ